jgi:hypothetical protein
MPRFFFDFYEGPRLIPDHDGLELDSLDAAEHEAMQTAAQLGRDWLTRKREVSLAVRDDQRRLVLAVSLELTVERPVPTRTEGSARSLPQERTRQ